MIWSIWLIDFKKKVELNNIFNSVNFYDLNFSFIQIELQNLQNQYQIVVICLFLDPGFASWDNCIIEIGNLANLMHKFDNNLKMLNTRVNQLSGAPL